MGDNGFTLVGQSGKPLKNGNTQLIFLEWLPRKLLNELLHRFSRYNNKLPLIISDIQQLRAQDNTLNKQLTLTASIDLNGKFAPSLYIDYKESGQNKKVFHVSIHLAPRYTSKYHNLIHFKNSKNVTRRLRVCGHNNISNAYCFRYNKNNDFDPRYNAEADIILQVLNSYFDPKKPALYLGNVRTSNKNHVALNQIETTMKQSLQTQSKSRTRKSQSSHSRNTRSNF